MISAFDYLKTFVEEPEMIPVSGFKK